MATTPNLGLHQWQSGDSFLRGDFNSDFSKIDAAVGAAPAKAHAAGVYQGTGDKTKPVNVNVGFSPSAVLVYQLKEYYPKAPILAIPGHEPSYKDQKAVEFTATGFRVNVVYEKSNGVVLEPYTNENYPYAYIAFR